MIGDRHLAAYLGSANYRANLLRLGWPEADLQAPGSDALFEAIVAWGDLDRIADLVRERFAAGADQVVLNLVAADPSSPAPRRAPRARSAGLKPYRRRGARRISLATACSRGAPASRPAITPSTSAGARFWLSLRLPSSREIRSSMPTIARSSLSM